MDLTFSWFADSGAWPEHPGKNDVAVDQEVVGPNGLLDHAETMLGFGGPDVAAIKRIAVYRRKIEAAGPGRFWSESFAFDPWSSARELLRWRDELVEAGWRPGVGMARRRLVDLSAAEAAGPKLPDGRADRLRAVIDALGSEPGLRLRSISLVDVRGTLPVGWRALLAALEASGVRIEELPVSPPSAPVGSDPRACPFGGSRGGDRARRVPDIAGCGYRVDRGRGARGLACRRRRGEPRRDVHPRQRDDPAGPRPGELRIAEARRLGPVAPPRLVAISPSHSRSHGTPPTRTGCSTSCSCRSARWGGRRPTGWPTSSLRAPASTATHGSSRGTISTGRCRLTSGGPIRDARGATGGMARFRRARKARSAESDADSRR